MIQAAVRDGSLGYVNTINIYDQVSTKSDIEYEPLWVIKSQFTGKEKSFIPFYSSVDYPRAATFIWVTVATQAAENLTDAFVFIGDTDYPLGLYDLEVYKNTSNTNLDKSGLTKLFTGLLNVKGLTDRESVTYSEYTTNDADTESVYVTI
tara:strand:- start:105 stop:554 length:450 start_codon:yes stop_codon:yes gene_type:complete